MGRIQISLKRVVFHKALKLLGKGGHQLLRNSLAQDATNIWLP